VCVCVDHETDPHDRKGTKTDLNKYNVAPDIRRRGKKYP